MYRGGLAPKAITGAGTCQIQSGCDHNNRSKSGFTAATCSVVARRIASDSCSPLPAAVGSPKEQQHLALRRGGSAGGRIVDNTGNGIFLRL